MCWLLDSYLRYDFVNIFSCSVGSLFASLILFDMVFDPFSIFCMWCELCVNISLHVNTWLSQHHLLKILLLPSNRISTLVESQLAIAIQGCFWTPMPFTLLSCDPCSFVVSFEFRKPVVQLCSFLRLGPLNLQSWGSDRDYIESMPPFQKFCHLSNIVSQPMSTARLFIS